MDGLRLVAVCRTPYIVYDWKLGNKRYSLYFSYIRKKRSKAMGMKQFFFLLLVTLGLFTGCNNNDDDSSALKSEFTYNGVTYRLDRGFIEDLGQNFSGETFDFDVTLISEGIERGPLGLTGRGNYIYLDLNTTSSDGLVPGIYNWSNMRSASSLVGGSEVGFGVNLDGTGGTQLALVDSSFVTVEFIRGVPNLTFTLKTTEGQRIEGQFEGELEEW